MKYERYESVDGPAYKAAEGNVKKLLPTASSTSAPAINLQIPCRGARF